MEQKENLKVHVSDVVKFVKDDSKEAFKRAVAAYINFLIVSSDIFPTRPGLLNSIDKASMEVLDMIDFCYVEAKKK